MHRINYQLDKTFLQTMKDTPTPWGVLGEFVFTRTYARWLTEHRRRENYDEVCERYTNYGTTLLKTHINKNGVTTISDEFIDSLAKDTYKAGHLLEVFPSGRTMWVGGTEAAWKYPSANFNCAFTKLESIADFGDLFYLLMVGTGVGGRVLLSDSAKFPKINTKVALNNIKYDAKDKEDRLENTILQASDNIVYIEVGDSKEGWVSALTYYLTAMTNPNTREIIVCYDNVRPEGERLKTFGGRASGPQQLIVMFESIHQVLCETNGTIKSIDLLDMANLVGQIVVAGGVRRTAEIMLIDINDEDCIKAKNYYWESKRTKHRKMSNNSILCRERIPFEELEKIFENIKIAAEPGFINEMAARLRRGDFEGVNPCVEILLRNKGFCNLSTIVMTQFVEDGRLNWVRLERAIEIAVWNCIKITLVDVELPQWDKVQKEDRLLGVSLTGFQDAMSMIDWDGRQHRQDRRDLLSMMHAKARAYADYVADLLGIPRPKLVTCVKPEGTLSCLPTVSSGLHWAFAEYFVRRVEISVSDPLLEVMKYLNYPIYVVPGEETEENPTKYGIEFPVYAPAKRTSQEVDAVEQLENYLDFQECWTEHNSSITVYVEEHEWDTVTHWVHDNWDQFVAVCFMQKSNHNYKYAPYEKITKEEYETRLAAIKPFDKQFLIDIERRLEETMDLDQFSLDGINCEGGACPVR